MNFLETIVAHKRQVVAEAKLHIPEKDLEGSAKIRIGFEKALTQNTGISLIAEAKKASPSKGVIRTDFNPVEIARIYQACGAVAMSVLTEEKYFQGDLQYIRQIHEQVDIPILRKDFIIDPYQLKETVYGGASAVLLIVAALSPEALRALLGQARALGLDALVEVHSREELETALVCGTDLIGINNRNLTTFEVSLQTTFELRPLIPAGVTVVSESGIQTRDDVWRLEQAGIDAVLIGEAFMVASDIGAKVRELFPQ